MGEIIPIPVLNINFELLDNNEKKNCRRIFYIRGLEVGEIIPFPVRIILFPVLKIHFNSLEKM